jgi:subtilisin family serine protease
MAKTSRDEMINTSRDKIIAYVSPRSIGGRSIFAPNAELRAGSIANYRSEKNVTAAAVSKIEEMGFKVEAVSELSVKISGTAAEFQKKMGVKFQKDESAMLVPTPDSMMNALDLGSEVLEGAAFPQPVEPHAKRKPPAKKGVGRKATKPPVAKKKAAKVARAEALASGISAVAPHLDYYHLNVPDDIVSIMNAGPVHAAGFRGQGVKAAMVDSGFAWTGHPYFQGKGYQLSADPPADADANGHGTGESANLLAIAPKVRLHGLLMNDSVAAFQAARNTLGVKIVSNSWGSRLPTDGPMSTWDPYWSLVLAEISLCVQSGMIVLFSGGNGGMSATASSPDVISVGGVYRDESDQLHATDYASSFMSFRFPGRQVPDVCGLCGIRPSATYIALPVPPGCEIDKGRGGGTFPTGDTTGKNDGWATFSGTSAACPMVAGVVALMLSRHSGLTLSDVRQRLETSCRDIIQGRSSMGDQAVPGRDLATGFGLVDAEAACR